MRDALFILWDADTNALPKIRYGRKCGLRGKVCGQKEGGPPRPPHIPLYPKSGIVTTKPSTPGEETTKGLQLQALGHSTGFCTPTLISRHMSQLRGSTICMPRSEPSVNPVSERSSRLFLRSLEVCFGRFLWRRKSTARNPPLASKSQVPMAARKAEATASLQRPTSSSFSASTITRASGSVPE
jgi:hypothetical protein